MWALYMYKVYYISSDGESGEKPSSRINMILNSLWIENFPTSLWFWCGIYRAHIWWWWYVLHMHVCVCVLVVWWRRVYYAEKMLIFPFGYAIKVNVNYIALCGWRWTDAKLNICMVKMCVFNIASASEQRSQIPDKYDMRRVNTPIHIHI